MRKGKIMIASATVLMLSLSGFLVYNFISDRNSPGKKDTGTASAMTVPSENIIKDNQNKENSGKYTYIPPTLEYDNNNGVEDVPNMNEITPTDIPWTPATEMDLDPASITVFVNKEFALPKDYVPENMVIPDVLFDILGFDERKLLRPEAASALELLFAAAQADGHTLYGISGYRSFDRQAKIFTDNIVKKGKKHTLKYSAVPGTSEHQTGLAIDVSTKRMKYRLVTTFASSPEGIWLADNAHHFGFIIRYPKDGAAVTGYAYEPWHIRYVGRDLANYLYKNNMTLDEYYNYVPSPDFDFEAVYAEYINYVPPVTPTPTPPLTPTPIPGDLDGDGIVDDLDGDGLPDFTDTEEVPSEEDPSEEEPSEGEASEEEGSETEPPKENPETEDPSGENIPGTGEPGNGSTDPASGGDILPDTEGLPVIPDDTSGMDTSGENTAVH